MGSFADSVSSAYFCRNHKIGFVMVARVTLIWRLSSWAATGTALNHPGMAMSPESWRTILEC